MKTILSAFLILLIVPLCMSLPLLADSATGLWVGTATLKYVGEINKQYADFGFDMGLTAVRAHDTLIASGDDWAFNYTGLDDRWYAPAPAPLGYQLSGVKTILTPSCTVQFRKTFAVSDMSAYDSLRFQVWRDDGVVLFLNGEEIFRNNLPADTLDFDTVALSEVTDNQRVGFNLPSSLLQPGQNVLVAEVHCAGGDDADFFFDLELNAVRAEPIMVELIPREADNWKYSDSDWGPGAADGEASMDANWPQKAYDDDTWMTGQGPFGYGENPEDPQTVSPSAPTVYFRKAFTLDDPDITHLRVLLLRDDGAVLYVNGIEILRSNMPAGDISHTTSPVKALGSVEEGRYISVDVPLSDLAGLALGTGPDGNVMAVEIHQHPAELIGGGGETALTRTSAPLDLRLLLHVDAGGTVRLLKEVIQMFDSARGRYVLLTDHTLVPNYSGVAYRDGEPVGRRISAIGIDFDGQSLACPGQVSSSGTVSCGFTLPSAHATNPFLHRYHPDHDNLDARYEQTVEEAYAVGREIVLRFSDRYPSDADEPVRAVKPIGWGISLLGGTYTETLTGLHKEAITVSGPFILRQVVTTGELMPQPQ